MGKELLLLRHAKSSWSDSGASDRDRLLSARGQRDAPMIGRALAVLLQPQVIHVSPARRAQLTLGGLKDGWPELRSAEHITEPALYTFAMHDVVEWLVSSGLEQEHLFLIGHNPALTELVNWLCNDDVISNLPTTGFVRLSLAVTDWSELVSGCGQLRQRLLPKEIKNAC